MYRHCYANGEIENEKKFCTDMLAECLMCLLAFMELEQADRKPKFDAIKADIEKK